MGSNASRVLCRVDLSILGAPTRWYNSASIPWYLWRQIVNERINETDCFRLKQAEKKTSIGRFLFLTFVASCS